ncbi:hypothetical protein Q5H93_10130 [Hymenobacter sp. ASUV-10]|uniref:Uncharacterized protein n=1 Tax=Hymenobacter aranciens TaxID=3063996 RepID=A0ABT9BA44_9BACT|nr:hypothetical protein [Hymenobacter sp. ASUV-10]MDO7875088.1 hypothetical protein [Hymenobacter sp. ASUV-10]
MEDYAAKMQLKTTAALREYVTSYTQYREEAVLAAFDELRRRGQPAPEEAALRPVLEPVAAAGLEAARQAEAEAARQRAEARAATTAADPDGDAAEPTGPFLYSPVSIIFFSLFFSMVAGGVLMGINLGRLKRWGALVQLVVFVVVYRVGSLLLLLQAGLNPLLASVMDLPALLVYLLWFWPRQVAVPSFRSRSWLPPLLVCVLVSAAMLWGVRRALPAFIDKQPKEQQQRLRELLGEPKDE